MAQGWTLLYINCHEYEAFFIRNCVGVPTHINSHAFNILHSIKFVLSYIIDKYIWKLLIHNINIQHLYTYSVVRMKFKRRLQSNC